MVRADQIRPLPDGVEHRAGRARRAAGRRPARRQPGRRPARPRRAGQRCRPDRLAGGRRREATAARPRVIAADLSASSLAVATAHGRRPGAEPGRRRHAARGRRAGLRGVRRAGRARRGAAGHRPRRHARPGRQPARHAPSPPSSATWSPGRSPGSARTGSSRRSPTPSRPCADGLDVAPLITHRFEIDQASEAHRRGRRPQQRQQQGHAAAPLIASGASNGPR